MAKIYSWLAGLMLVVMLVGGIYAKGQIDARHTAEVAQLTETLELTKRKLETERKAHTLDAEKAAKDAKQLSALETKIGDLNSYVETLEDADRECLSGADTERLRDLWR